MNEKLEKHIMEKLEAYEKDKLTDFEYFEKDKILCKVVDKEIKLLELLDDKQADAFREYSLALLVYKDIMSTEYFSAGFVHGLFEEKTEFDL